jgi:hypothetical protein
MTTISTNGFSICTPDEYVFIATKQDNRENFENTSLTRSGATFAENDEYARDALFKGVDYFDKIANLIDTKDKTPTHPMKKEELLPYKGRTTDTSINKYQRKVGSILYAAATSYLPPHPSTCPSPTLPTGPTSRQRTSLQPCTPQVYLQHLRPNHPRANPSHRYS